MSALPQHWEACRLGDVVDYGMTSKAEPDAIPDEAWVLELEDIEKDTSKILQRVTFAQRRSRSTKNRFAAGDILYGKLRPYLNKVIRADQDGFCTTEIVPLVPGQWVDGAYLFHWLKHPAFLQYVTAASHGLNMPRLGTEAGRNAPFVLAPLPEQKRIAQKLDGAFARMSTCRERLERIPAILKRFRQSAITAAVSGSLTGVWRAANSDRVSARTLAEEIHRAHEIAGGHRPGNAAPPTEDVHNLTLGTFPHGWNLLTLRDLVLPDRPITYGILKPGPQFEDGVIYVRVADFPNDRLNRTTLRRTSIKIDQVFKRSRLRDGDLLVSIRGTVGRVVVIPAELDGANITQDSARLSIQPTMNRDFVAWYLRSELAQERMKGATKGVAVRGINIGDVRALQVPVPSRQEQDEIVRRIKALTASADRAEASYVTARDHVERLGSSLLTKAFRGDLVLQDPTDEPASLLLDRIREETGPDTTLQGRKQMTSKHRSQVVRAVSPLLKVLATAGKPLTPEELFELSGRDPEVVEQVEEFFNELRELMKRRKVKESRPTKSTVLLSAKR